jgi:sporulation protein YlmC with PRC-barrel domain
MQLWYVLRQRAASLCRLRYNETDMLQLSKSLYNQPVMSLRTGGQVAIATAPIINPNNLRIEGWYCQDNFSKNTLILLSQDVRDVIRQGLVVNDHDNLCPPDELVRLKEVLDLRFELLGKPAYSNSKQKLGKVGDYAVEIETLYIQKIYLSQSLMKSFSGGTLSVDRDQIIEITDRKVVIQDPLKPTKAEVATAPASL